MKKKINGKTYTIGPNANLSRASLSGADLSGANLSGADLSGANLFGANLSTANLSNANLSKANLFGANLSEANLSKANLSKARLSGANLSEANLSKANLSKARLSGANLFGANLSEANLSKANLPAFQIPQEGELIVWKKASLGLVKLRIPPNARRTASLVGRKCRAEFAEVLQGSGKSLYDPSVCYKVGETVRPHNYSNDIRVECAPGIHFFMTRKEAGAY
jgi:hypothetical protein